MSRAPSGGGSLSRGGQILKHFAEWGTEISVRELSEALGVPRSTVHRVCQQLVEEGFLIQRTDDEGYDWGQLLVSISSAVTRSMTVDQMLDDVLERLMARTDETALLTQYDRTSQQIRIVRQVESHQPVLYRATLHTPMAVHAGASGRSVLAYLPDDEIEAIVSGKLDRITENTLVEPTALRAELQEVRERGIAVSRGERAAGAVGHCCPVFDASGGVYGSLCVSVPSYRHTPDLETVISTVLPESARHVSQILGWPGRGTFPPDVPTAPQ